MWTEEHRNKAPHYAQWMRRRWNRDHGASQQVESMQIYYMLELTRPDYQPPYRADILIYEWFGDGAERTVSFQESLIQGSDGI